MSRLCGRPSAPILLGFPLHCRALRTFRLDPVRRTTGTVVRVLSLRNDPLKAPACRHAGRQFALLAGASLGAAAVQGLHAQAKPKAYTISELQTIGSKAAADFTKRVSEPQTKAGGHNFRTAGGKVVGLEGPPPP